MSCGRFAVSWLPYAVGFGAPYQVYGAGSHSQVRSAGQSVSVASAAGAEGSPVLRIWVRSGVTAVAGITTRWPAFVVRAAPLRRMANTSSANSAAVRACGDSLYDATAPYHWPASVPAPVGRPIDVCRSA